MQRSTLKVEVMTTSHKQSLGIAGFWGTSQSCLRMALENNMTKGIENQLKSIKYKTFKMEENTFLSLSPIFLNFNIY